MNYIGTVHNLAPEDPMLRYRGQAICEYVLNDFHGNFAGKAIFLPPGEERDEKIKKLVGEFHKMMENLGKLLPADKKFICSDNTCIYDFIIGGYFCNLVLNEYALDTEMWTKEYEKAPARVK